MPGAFDSPFGSTPFGSGTPLPAGPPPTGNSSLCRFIDGATGDYQVDPTTGHLAGMSLLDQRILIALTSIKGSSTVLPNMGITHPAKIDASMTRLMQAEARAALFQLTDVERAMRIDDLLVEQVPPVGRVQLTVNFTDLATGQQRTVKA